MKDNRKAKWIALAVALALVCALALPAGAAGLMSWLFGSDEEAVAASADATAPPAVTLPPADALVDAEATGEAVPTPAPLAPVPDATIEDDGLVRVALLSLESPAQLHLTLSGVYAVDGDPGFRFERETRLALSEALGHVYMSVGGLTMNMGASMTLSRHRAGEGEVNGLYIDESEKDTLYPGDLTVSVAEGGGLRAVLKLPVEDYLLGVVAYEMSDSFPIEALKAQAIAARTYALQRKWQSAGRDYDVADTTADQVFKGVSDEYANVAEAVTDTCGVVGLYDGTFAVCYYTASNGGQTALPSQLWGLTDADGYLAMVDDPYDVENPRSLANVLTISPDCGESPALKEMLEAALSEPMATDGWGDGEWKLDGIEAIEPVNPRFEGSKLYDGLAFTLRAQVYAPIATPEADETPEATDAPTTEPTPEATAEHEAEATADESAMPTAPDEPLSTPTPVPREWTVADERYTVVLDVFRQIKDGLVLGINGSDIELVSVETQADADGQPAQFTIALRRFGHGVGMSQRGAQWMAGHYGKNWQEILAFYYPGLSFEKMAWPEDQLTDLDALPEGVGAARPKPTPTPTPAPLPALEEGEHYATVTATTLNLRQQPTTASMALAQLAKGRQVIVRGEADENGWVAVRTAELEGYVKEEYLE